jgi:hypothetical protein
MGKAKSRSKERTRRAEENKVEAPAEKSGAKELTPVEVKISREPVNTAKVRENIKNMVWNAAEAIAIGLIGAAASGELAPTRYLFEAAGLYPVNEETKGNPQEDSLAYTLLKHLGLPTEPVTWGQESPPEDMTIKENG